MTFARDSWPTLIPTAPSASATQGGWKLSAPSQVLPTSQLGLAAQIVIVRRGFRMSMHEGLLPLNQHRLKQAPHWRLVYTARCVSGTQRADDSDRGCSIDSEAWCDYMMSFLANTNASYTSDKSACKKNRKKKVSPPSSREGLSVLVGFFLPNWTKKWKGDNKCS